MTGVLLITRKYPHSYKIFKKFDYKKESAFEISNLCTLVDIQTRITQRKLLQNIYTIYIWRDKWFYISHFSKLSQVYLV